MYSNSCCSCSFEPEIIKIGQPFNNMYGNNILKFQESKTILNACTKKSGNLLNAPRIYIYIYRKNGEYEWMKIQSTNLRYLFLWIVGKICWKTTLVDSDPKAPFSIATTPICREGLFSFPWIAPGFTLDTYLIMLSIKQGGIKYHFLSLWYDSTWDWTPGFPDHWRTLYSLCQ